MKAGIIDKLKKLAERRKLEEFSPMHDTIQDK